MIKVNSENYWDQRFKKDWDHNKGDKQSIFFMNLALSMFPKWLTELLNNNNLSVCDWGCAEGEGTNILANKFPRSHFVGIDFAETAIKIAKQRYDKKNISFEKVDLLTEDYDKKYDIIFCSNTFEHFSDPWEKFNKVSEFAKDLFVIMVPFNEDKDHLIPEHFTNFTRNNIFLNNGEWSVVHFVVKDVSTLKPTYWGGQQAFIIFARNKIIPNLNLTFNDVYLGADHQIMLDAMRDNKINELKNMNNQLKRRIKEQDRDIHKKNLQIIELSNHISSLRYKIVSKLANVANIAIPKGSIRRKFVTSPIYISRYMRDTPERRQRNKNIKDEIIYRKNFEKDLIRLANQHTSVILYINMPWDNIMRQRPHHIAEQLANLGHLVVYVDEDAERPRKLNDNLVIVDGLSVVEVLIQSNQKNKYFMFPAGYSKPFTEIQSIVSKGFKFIYEYIDELDESISGKLLNQKELYTRLEELDPVLLIASAKKLFKELSLRFSEEKTLLNRNGVDITHFDHGATKFKNLAPLDIQEILNVGKPIVGYYGAMASWLDYKLINELAVNRQDLSFVYIGVNYNNGSRLKLGNNVFYLGPKPYNSLPDYSYWFNCAIIPFKKGEIAKSTSPIKLFEYMAMGLPTVCTRDLNECEGYEYVYISKTPSEFNENINKAIRDKKYLKTQQKLIDQAIQNTWQARAKAISDKIASPHDNVKGY